MIDEDRAATVATEIVPELLHGALDLERGELGLRPHRLPARVRARADAQLRLAESQPSGVRLVFRSAATVIEVDALRTTLAFAGVPPRPDGRYDLLVDGELVARATSSGGIALVTDLSTGVTETYDGPVATVRFADLPARDKRVEIWLPHHETTELVALRTDAPVEVVPPGGRRVWLHHGSSISQGSNAESPTTTWPALAAARGGVDLVNLGFSGSAMADSFVARTVRDQPADLVSVKLGINLTNADAMRMRAFTPAVHGFLDTVRDGHPTTPLLVITPVLCPIHEDTPGPPPAPARPTSPTVRCASARPATRATSPRGGYTCAPSARSSPASLPSAWSTTRTCTYSTASPSTAKRTPSITRCPTDSTPTPPPTGS
jgi:hypothetical protein